MCQSHTHVTDSFSSVHTHKNIDHAFERVYIFILLLAPVCMDHGDLGNSEWGREETHGLVVRLKNSEPEVMGRPKDIDL